MLYYKKTDKVHVQIKPLDPELILDPKSPYYYWMNDINVTANNSHGLFPKSMEEITNFAHSLRKNNGQIIWSIFARIPLLHSSLFYVGNISLQRIDFIYRSSEIAIMIGDTNFWGKGVGTIACELAINHGFNKLNLNRIWSGTSATNIGMQKVFNKLGFIKEGDFREGMYLNGRYTNITSYGLLKKDWLENNENSPIKRK